MPGLWVRFVDLFRPREGWAPFLLTLTALLCLPAALLQPNPDVSAGGLVLLILLAVIIGLRLARSRLPAWGAAFIGLLLGAALILVVVARLYPPLSLLRSETRYTFEWLRLWQQRVPSWPLPFASLGEFLWLRLYELGLRLWWWSQTFASGSPAQDSIIFVLLAAPLAWGFGLFATWQIYRRRSALIGLLPAGIAVATIAFFNAGTATLTLITFLFCTLWLVAICTLWQRVEHWEKANTDYPGSLGLELILTVGPWLAPLFALAFIFPIIRPSEIYDTFWKLLNSPWSSAEGFAERVFGPIQGGYAAGSVPGSTGSLPRGHLLGGRPELSETIVMYVSTNDPPPPVEDPHIPEMERPEPPRRYWRGSTFDTYTGVGWLNSRLEPGVSPPDQPLNPNPAPGYELIQFYDVVAENRSLVYAANEPLRLSHAVQTWWRAPGDLAQMTGEAQRYTAISRLQEPTSAELREAPDGLPSDDSPPASTVSTAETPGAPINRYLALPETVPQRVAELTAEVIGDAETRYDQAKALEAFLRTYTYTLDLPAPPYDRDLVDYFLFDIQRGYCDYYASAMVVMARTAGIPARLASGYAQGAYDHKENRWVVTEKDAHSWVEIYFEGIGWVEFEPTAGLPALKRPGGGAAAYPTVHPLPPRPTSGAGFPWALLVVGGILVVAVGVLAFIWLPHRQADLVGNALVRNRHARLVRWGARLKSPLRDGQTPHEYGEALSEMLRARGQASRWSQVRGASAGAPPEVERLTETFVRAQYGPEPISDRESWQIRDLWARLRGRLWWLWLGRG